MAHGVHICSLSFFFSHHYVPVTVCYLVSTKRITNICQLQITEKQAE